MRGGTRSEFVPGLLDPHTSPLALPVSHHWLMMASVVLAVMVAVELVPLVLIAGLGPMVAPAAARIRQRHAKQLAPVIPVDPQHKTTDRTALNMQVARDLFRAFTTALHPMVAGGPGAFRTPYGHDLTARVRHEVQTLDSLLAEMDDAIRLHGDGVVDREHGRAS